jgi:hypothetical protein
MLADKESWPKWRKWQDSSAFFDDPPKTLRQIHHHHCIADLMPDENSKRIKEKYGETMTKFEKRKGATTTYGRPLASNRSGLVSQ